MSYHGSIAFNNVAAMRIVWRMAMAASAAWRNGNGNVA